MNTADFIVIGLLVLWAVLAVKSMIKQKRSGKCHGCCGCRGCGKCGKTDK